MLEWILTPQRIVAAASLAGAYGALCAGIAFKLRQARLAQLREQQDLQGPDGEEAVLLVYASQTGHAEMLARRTAHALHGGGCAVRLMPVQQLQARDLERSRHSLWLVSTTGEGDAPDHALPFVRKLLGRKADLARHSSLLLALGDHSYAQFCAFGQRVQQWLEAQAAQVERISMHSFDAEVWGRWQQRVQQLAHALGREDELQWQQAAAFSPWVLRRRELLNPGSQGEPVHLLELEPQGGNLPEWRSGDLVELKAPADPGRPREYSIASIPAQGCVQLLVRQSVRADGSPGIASGWLCTGMAEGGSVALRLRAHRGFRLEDNAERPLVLIGNGTGLAGLLGHIRARIHQGRSDQWLLVGERSSSHDAFCDAELQQWLRDGQLARLDRAWSRDGQAARYVQHILAEQAARLRQWVEQGAAIYVCGSLQGMAQGVDEALRQALGAERVDALRAEGRYRRDVY